MVLSLNSAQRALIAGHLNKYDPPTSWRWVMQGCYLRCASARGTTYTISSQDFSDLMSRKLVTWGDYQRRVYITPEGVTALKEEDRND